MRPCSWLRLWLTCWLLARLLLQLRDMILTMMLMWRSSPSLQLQLYRPSHYLCRGR